MAAELGDRVRHRPLGASVVAVVGGLALTSVMVGMWFAFPAEIRDGFKTVEVVTLVVFLAACWVFLLGMVRTQVVADDRGVRVRNGYRRHELSWDEVDDVVLAPGMPWAELRLRDGSRRAVIAVQRTDGSAAVAVAARLRTLLLRSRD